MGNPQVFGRKILINFEAPKFRNSFTPFTSTTSKTALPNILKIASNHCISSNDYINLWWASKLIQIFLSETGEPPSKKVYLTRAIKTRGLYIFYPIFHCGLYWRAVYITGNLCTKKVNSLFFSLKSAVYTQERVIVALVRYILCLTNVLTLSPPPKLQSWMKSEGADNSTLLWLDIWYLNDISMLTSRVNLSNW